MIFSSKVGKKLEILNNTHWNFAIVQWSVFIEGNLIRLLVIIIITILTQWIQLHVLTQSRQLLSFDQLNTEPAFLSRRLREVQAGSVLVRNSFTLTHSPSPSPPCPCPYPLTPSCSCAPSQWKNLPFSSFTFYIMVSLSLVHLF